MRIDQPTSGDREKHILVFILTLISGYAMGLHSSGTGSFSAIGFAFILPGLLLGSYYVWRRTGPFKHIQGLTIGYALNFIYAISSTDQFKGFLVPEGLAGATQILIFFAIGIAITELMELISAVLVWPAAFMFGFYTSLNLLTNEFNALADRNAPLKSLVAAFVLLLCVGFVKGKRTRQAARARSGWTLVRAPHRPTLTDTFQVDGDLVSIALNAIETFESEVRDRNVGEFREKSVIYLDGMQPVPPGASLGIAELELPPAGVRSTAFRVRRGLDEWWFVLHVKGLSRSMSIQLDCKHRSLNIIVPLIMFGTLAVVALAWQSHSQPVVGAGIAILATCGVLFQLGIIDLKLSNERGEARRNERLSEYYPSILRAAAVAIETAKAGLVAPVEDVPNNANENPPRQAEPTPANRPRID